VCSKGSRSSRPSSKLPSAAIRLATSTTLRLSSRSDVAPQEDATDPVIPQLGGSHTRVFGERVRVKLPELSNLTWR